MEEKDLENHKCDQCDAEFSIVQEEGFEDQPWYCPFCGEALIEE